MKVALQGKNTDTHNILQEFLLKQARNILLDTIKATLNILGTTEYNEPTNAHLYNKTLI
jgi:hypothetical protein